jgi:hypothetical protein
MKINSMLNKIKCNKTATVNRRPHRESIGLT